MVDIEDLINENPQREVIVKSIYLFLCSFNMLACGGNTLNETCSQESDNRQQSGCANSPYTWQDPVLFVCPVPLPASKVSGQGYIEIGTYELINYRNLTAYVSSFCVQITGEPLEQIQFVNFIQTMRNTVSLSSLSGPPWPSNGRVCTSNDLFIDPQSQESISIRIQLASPIITGSSYQTELVDSSFISVRDDQLIAGPFPIREELVQISGN